jgi:hypothetical protein
VRSVAKVLSGSYSYFRDFGAAAGAQDKFTRSIVEGDMHKSWRSFFPSSPQSVGRSASAYSSSVKEKDMVPGVMLWVPEGTRLWAPGTRRQRQRKSLNHTWAPAGLAVVYLSSAKPMRGNGVGRRIRVKEAGSRGRHWLVTAASVEMMGPMEMLADVGRGLA